MDKNTLSQYGWVVIVIIVLLILIALATPFGSFVAKSVKSSVEAFDGKVGNMFDDADINYNSPEFAESAGTKASQNGGSTPVSPSSTGYTAAQIAADDHLFAIGATQPEYVVAQFNEDYTVLTIIKNGENSDGVAINFSQSTSDAENQYKSAHSESELTDKMYSTAASIASGTPYDIPRSNNYVQTGYENAFNNDINTLLVNGQAAGKFDSNGNPLTEDAMDWASEELLKITNGFAYFTDSGDFGYNGGTQGFAKYIRETSNNAYSYYDGQGCAMSLYSMYQFYSEIGATPTPAWLAEGTITTIIFSDGVTGGNGIESGLTGVTINR